MFHNSLPLGMRLGLPLCIAALLFVGALFPGYVPELAAAETVVVSGDVSFTVETSAAGNGTARLPSGAATLLRSGAQVSLRGADGTFLAHAILKDGRVAINGPEGQERYAVEFDGAVYRVSETGFLRHRVKIKDDKFNIYDPQDKRILHGKQKDAEWVVKKEDGTKALKITGTHSLRETSFLSVPIPAECRVVLWAVAPQ